MANRRAVVRAIVAVVVLAGAGIGIALGLSGGGHPPTVTTTPDAAAEALAAQARVVAAATRQVALSYPTTTGQAAPVWSPSAFATPLPKHVVFGFVPYYSLDELTSADYRDVSTIAYDGLALLRNGGIDESSSDPGWQAFDSVGFTQLVSTAHAQHDQVLVTAYSETQSVIAKFLADPQASATRLADQLQPLLADDHLDGVDIDIEGNGPALRPKFVSFVRDLTSRLRDEDPSAVVVLDTYPGSAGDRQSFFDVQALAPLVSTMFVMAYDMYVTGNASPNAPLATSDLGLSDVSALLAYTKVVPAKELLLGIPFYGYDFTVRSDAPNARTTSSVPVAVTWQSILQAAHPPKWDPSSDTPWYSFKLKKAWHETYFDNPASIALKTALASELHLEGVGVWALGMEAGDDTMLDALLGGQPPRKLALSASTVLSDAHPAPPGRSAA